MTLRQPRNAGGAASLALRLLQKLLIKPHIAFVGLGANLGDLQLTLGRALAGLAALPFTRLLAVSSAYQTAPVDARGPDYLNAVAKLQTGLDPLALLAALQALELEQGRERSYQNAPRTLDLDLLLYDELRLANSQLTLPHPRLQQRAFVLLPLLEISPGLQAPGLGDLTAYLPEVAEQAIKKLDVPW